MRKSRQMTSRFVTALITVLITMAALVSATFAWYMYQTQAHTTNIHMAVGTGFSLQISNTYNDGYSSSTKMEEYKGYLSPVSTDRIQNGFQRVIGFKPDATKSLGLAANIYEISPHQDGNRSDFYKSTIYVKAKGNERPVYLSQITGKDSDEANPISTAIRVGFVVHEPGENKPATGEYVFELSDKQNPEFEYNTWGGEEGYVLDSTKTDGTVVKFDKLYTDKNYCEYDKATGVVTLKPDSVPLFNIQGSDDRTDYGTPVQIDVYVWLEGCDKDCTNNLDKTTLESLSISFACENGIMKEPIQ